MGVIYVLKTGRGTFKRNVIVTPDVKVVCKAYTNVVKAGYLGQPTRDPFIEIWITEYLKYGYQGKDTNPKKLWKYLSKVARGI